MGSRSDRNEWATTEHVLKYLARVDQIPHRAEGEAVLLEFIPQKVKRILDLGTGDGRLLALLRIDRQDAEGVALDFSPAILAAARTTKRLRSLSITWMSRCPISVDSTLSYRALRYITAPMNGRRAFILRSATHFPPAVFFATWNMWNPQPLNSMQGF